MFLTGEISSPEGHELPKSGQLDSFGLDKRQLTLGKIALCDIFALAARPMNALIQMTGAAPLDASSRQGRMAVRAREQRCLETTWRLPGRTAAPGDEPQGGTVAPASIAG